MPDTIYKYIPIDPHTKLKTTQIHHLKYLHISGARIDVEISDQMQFADAGGNFESVICPFCHSNLISWWGDEMDKLYSLVDGFSCLTVITPCCGKEISLNNLEYEWPQGFYRTMVSLVETSSISVDKGEILSELEKLTGIGWRLVIAHI